MQELLAHIAKFISLDDSEQNMLLSKLSVSHVRKKQHLLEPGRSADQLFFVVKGCLRLYIINEKGNEQTHQFVIENWWTTDFLAFHNDAPSDYYIQAVEDSDVLILDKTDFEYLMQKIPPLERYFRLCYEKAVGAAQKRINYLFTFSAEQRYRNMHNKFPEFIQRVPQYMLASYLDFSAELMSKIRAGKT